jgi:broad specificity phosphatase PhoE
VSGEAWFRALGGRIATTGGSFGDPGTKEAPVSLARLLDARRGPVELVLVRHAESVGNIADVEARSRGADRLDLTARDADVELSDTGRKQADTVGAWLAAAHESERPTLVVASPYRRAAETAERVVKGIDVEVLHDERLRERDLGVLDGLTGTGIRAIYPEEAERRTKLGKFYYQPPSGESWADVVLRVRSILADLREGCDGARVWLFSHQAVIMSFRYVLEGHSEPELLDLERAHRVANVSMTRYRRGAGGYELERFNDTSVLDRSSEVDVTREGRQAGLEDEATGRADG